MATIIKKNVILSPAEYDGVSNQKGIVTFEILNTKATGFLRCYNLDSKDNLVFGVKINDKMSKFKIPNGQDSFAFSLENPENILNAKISCVLVKVGAKVNTLLIGSTETTSIYASEMIKFMDNTEQDKMVEKVLEEKLNEQNAITQNLFKDEEFKESNEVLKFKNQELQKLTEDEKENLYEEEFSNYIDDLVGESENKCQNCMYKNYFYCKNESSKESVKEKINALSSGVKEITKGQSAKTSFYEGLSSQIDSLITASQHEEVLEEILPNSTFVRIDKQNGSYYVLGVINNEEGTPEYLCYGHPAKSIEDKPFNFDNHFSFLPIDVESPNGAGYYLSYQSAQNGENVKLTLI